ncbi:PREDICTED: prolyl 4-hydroxylase subunit alpha-2-like [Papilio xuthus]|uniref:procollagen-proline 4-dioxygenase n=1 Tax=Papilio xuthus TaxID=66420 RepID=A0AAJ6ZY70_PAPXU|nr:PREDICTED: prolyl 4-hydroxylase subunit alpha-2-like [Papilio xuthus]
MLKDPNSCMGGGGKRKGKPSILNRRNKRERVLVTTMFFKISLFLICYCKLSLWTEAEVYTAVTELAPLLHTLDRTIEDLEYFIEKEKKSADTLITQLNIYKMEKKLASKDYSEYLENPVNAYTLIKRLTSDIDYLTLNIQNITKDDTINLRHEDLVYPTIEDLIGSALALSRLQSTYALNVTKLAEKRLNNESFGIPMTVNDCFKLGQTLYQHKKFKHSLEWFIEALRKYKRENETYGVSEIDILNYISYALYYADNAKTVFKSTKQILNIDKEYAIKIEDSISALESIEMLEEIPITEDTSEEDDEGSEEYQRYFIKEQFVYEALCRGEIDLPTEVTKRLKCSYLTDTHPFLKLAPIKTEQLYIEPDVFVFYNVISDEEIEQLKILSKERLKRSEVAGYSDFTNDTIAKYRISKTAWLYDVDSSVAARVSRRAAYFTGFSTASAEPLQIVNYGLGGHFSPHFDFFLSDTEPDLPKMKEYGNRIATTIFYMSEVTEGGATVFTELGLTVFPVKNAALYWLNLHPSGEGDITTRHAACPVLRGSKWISNKWFHQAGQEAIRPCNLEYQIENVKRNISMPRPKTKDEYHRQLIIDWFTNNGLEKSMYE